MTAITKAVMDAMHKEFPKASEKDLEQIFNAREAKNKQRALTGVPSADDIHFDSDVAERGKKIILDSVRKGAELTREVFLFMRACEDVDYIEGTFKVAESRALKALSDGQPEGEPKIKSLSDIAKIQGGAGAGSYIATKSRLLKIVKNEGDMVNTLQAWYDWQAKHSGEPQTFVQEDLLNIWSKRYEDDKTGWSRFTRDARICDQAKMSLAAAQKAHERAKGKDAAAQTGQNGDQHQQGMASGARQRPDLSPLVMKSLNEVIRVCHSVASEVDENGLSTILEGCANAMVLLLNATRQRKENRAPETATDKGPERAAQSTVDTSAAIHVEDTDQPAVSAVGAEPTEPKGDVAQETGESLVKPEWIDQADWDASAHEERIEMMADREAYEEEKQLFAKVQNEKQDAESNEPSLPGEDAKTG